MITSSTPPTWRRWWMLTSQSRMTLLRLLEYERLQGLSLEGIILDVGGGRASHYYPMLPTGGTIQTVNLNPQMEPTYIADLNHGLPVAEERYDCIISLNTLEHVRRDVHVLREMFRVLKTGGGLYLFVPFLYRVHASPDDYHRHTAQFWVETLEEIGFSGDTVKVEPLNFGPLSTPLSMVEWAFPLWVRACFRAVALLASMAWYRLRPTGERSSGRDTPLGYLVSAQK
jgi:SAM-dependent methyltransferase